MCRLLANFNFVTHSTYFKCRRCAKCCSLDVMLGNEEMEGLRESSDSKWHTTRKIFDGTEIHCCLLANRSCLIYESRPRQCRLYPFSVISESQLSRFHIFIDASALRFQGPEGEKYLIIYDDECPGVGRKGNQDWSEVVELGIEVNWG